MASRSNTPSDSTLADRLTQHVRTLSETIGTRSVRHPQALRHAADYVADTLRSLGLLVEIQDYAVGCVSVRNVIATTSGSGPSRPMIVLGAHYDTCDVEPERTPGADDNASGVAALIELARRAAARQPERIVRFIAFANEEPPFFQTDAMGSFIYAKAAKARGERIELMLSLEMLGYYDERPGSQTYPPLFGIGRPTRGNFISFVGRTGSGGLLKRLAGAFRTGTSFPLEVGAAPEWVPGVSFSDQWAFWQFGYPAIMVTDTALYRNPHYHSESDTWETLNYAKMACVVEGLEQIITEFACPR